MKRCAPRFIYPLLILILASFLSPSQTFSQEVPLNVALTGALHYAQEVFGPLVFEESQTFVDLDGSRQVYIFFLEKKEYVTSHDLHQGMITVVSGANKTHVPVMQMYKGLPDHVGRFTEIKEVLRDRTGFYDWEVASYIYPAPFQFWLEVFSKRGEERVYIRPSDMEIMTRAQMEERVGTGTRSRGPALTDEVRQARVRKKWEFIEGIHQKRAEGIVDATH